MKIQIRDKAVKSILIPDRGSKIYYDLELKGFGIRVTSKGAKSFVLNYHVHRRERRMTIGSYPAWTVAAAREEAKKLKRLIELGQDPLAEREEINTAPSVSDLWQRFRTEHIPDLADRSQKDQISMWERYIVPELGNVRLSQLTASDTDNLHRLITRHAPVRANRVLESLRKALNHAVRWGWIERNPAHGFRRNPEVPKETFLSEADLTRSFECLEGMSNQKAANAIRLLILTGARRGEVLNAEWSEFDLERGLWIKPSSHTKQKRVHRVPLSPQAIALLENMKCEAEGPLLFPTSNGHAMQDFKRSWIWFKKEMGLPHLRIHDLRHSYASFLVSDGQPLTVIGKLLGHTQSQTTMRYAHLYDDTLREATSRIGSAISGA